MVVPEDQIGDFPHASLSQRGEDDEKNDVTNYNPTHVKTIDSTIPLNAVEDSILDKHITRKFDRHIIPWLFGLWLLAFIDRSNIGNAKIDGLTEDLHLTGDQFNSALAIFYVPYICVDVPSNWVLKYFKAGFYLPSLMIAWGIVSTFLGFVKDFKGLLAARFFLGLCEGGLLGGMIIYLAMFYRRHELVARVGMFYCAAPLSGAFGGLLATGLAEINTKGYHGWPFIFFVEGAITVCFGIFTLFFLPHTPASSKFLSPAEKTRALERLHLDSHGAQTTTDVSTERFSWHWVRMALLNWNTLLLSLNFFAIITPIYSFSLFLPTIISTLGYTRVTAQLFTVPPNMCAFVTVLLATFASNHFKCRGPFMLMGSTLAIVGYILLLAGNRPAVQYGGTFLVASGVFPCSPLVMSWLANNLAPHYVRATGTGFQILIANCAAFIATFTYLSKDAPKYTTGHFINVGMLIFDIVLIILNIIYVKWENRRRDKGERDYRLQEEDEDLLGHRHPHFRYTF